MSLSSVVYFEKTALDYGVPQEVIDKMKPRGWTTMGAFAFSCSVNPNGASAGDAFLKEVVEPLLGEGAGTSPVLPSLRRLFFEAWMVHTSDLKYRIEKRDDDPPRMLPDIEKADRKSKLKERLGEGLKMEAEADPADSLIDLAVEIYETRTVKRIPWEKCICQEAEAEGIKVIPELQCDKNGVLKVGQGTVLPDADTSDTTLLMDVLVRRGLALDIGQVVSWEAHSVMVADIRAAIRRKPLPGFRPVTFEQVADFDKEVWRRVAEEAKGEFRYVPGSPPPLDAILRKVIVEHRVAMLLVGRPGERPLRSMDSSEEVRTLKRKVESLEQQVRSGGASSRTGTYNESKMPPPKKKKESAAMRKAARGLDGMAKTHLGKPLCFGYNLGTCSDAKPGGACKKGLHICGGCKEANCAWHRCRSWQ